MKKMYVSESSGKLISVDSPEQQIDKRIKQLEDKVRQLSESHLQLNDKLTYSERLNRKLRSEIQNLNTALQNKSR